MKYGDRPITRPGDDLLGRSRRTSHRISRRDFAEAYFTLNPDPATWGRNEFERLISEGPEIAFAILHERIESSFPTHRTRLRRLFLELLDAAFSSSKELTQEWLNKILAESPYLLLEKDTAARFLFTIDNEDRLRWLITNGLEKLDEPRRVELLKNAIRSAEDFTVLSDVVRGVVGDSGIRSDLRTLSLPYAVANISILQTKTAGFRPPLCFD